MKKLFLSLTAFMLISAQYLVAQTFDVVTIMENGPTSEKVNYVFLGDGYQASELDKFITDVEKVTEAYFSTYPYNAIKTDFNVFAIKVPSNESGASLTPAMAIDNYFGSSFGVRGIDRLLVPRKLNLVHNVANANTPYFDQLFVIVNDSKYGGSGGSIATFSTNLEAIGLALHEAGHSYAKLADEYWAGSHFAIEKANLTQTSDPATVKWSQFVGQKEVGVYPHEEDPSWYRPHQECKMRALSGEFCEVCANEILTITSDIIGDPDTTLEVPTNLSASAIATNSFTANWQNSSGATSYDIQLWENDVWVTKATSLTVNSYKFTGLVAGSTQNFRVRASDGTNVSEYSPSFTVTLSTDEATIPAVPSGLNASDITSTSFTANWTTSSGASSYDIQFWEGTWVLKASPITNSYTVTGLKSGSTQYFRVRATNSFGSSAYSNWIRVTLTSDEITIPAVPSGLSTSRVTATSFTANWTASSGAISYDVQFWEGRWVLKGSPTTNSYNATGLEPGSTQYFRVRATNSSGSSVYSNWTAITLSSAAKIEKEKDFIIFPNPAKNLIYINNEFKNAFIKIVDIRGSVVLEKNLKNDSELDVSSLKSGVYILSLKSKSLTKNVRFVKE